MWQKFKALSNTFDFFIYCVLFSLTLGPYKSSIFVTEFLQLVKNQFS